MGRSPCCSKEGLNRGAWTALEDKILTAYIKAHGEGKWRNLPKRAGLKRCGKSCRLRWLNYLRPDIKRGNISRDEEELIIRLHNLLGNRWSLIAGRLPGRTDNEIKNYWNTTLGKKLKNQRPSVSSQQTSRANKQANDQPKTPETSDSTQTQVIRTKATRPPKILVPFSAEPLTTDDQRNHNIDSTTALGQVMELQDHHHHLKFEDCREEDNQEAIDFLNFDCDEIRGAYNEEAEKLDCDYNSNLAYSPSRSFSFNQPMLEDWPGSHCLEDNAIVDLDSLAFLLDPDQWPSQNNHASLL